MTTKTNLRKNSESKILPINQNPDPIQNQIPNQIQASPSASNNKIQVQIQNLSEHYKTQLLQELTKLDNTLAENLADPIYTDIQKQKLISETEHLKQIITDDFIKNAEFDISQKQLETQKAEQDKIRREQIPIEYDSDGVPIFNTEKFLTYSDYVNSLNDVQKDILNKRRKKQVKQAEQQEKIRKFEEKKFRIGRIIHDSGIPSKYAKKNIADFLISDKNEQQAITLLQAIKNDKSYYIFGDNGTGKTLISSIIVNERAKLFKTSVFMRSVKIFTSLNPFYNHSDTITERKHLYENTPCLIIDDLGAEKPSDFTKQTLFEIIDSRYNNDLQTIITSNFSLQKLIKRIGEYEGKRIARRILEMCQLIELKYFDKSPFTDLDDDE